MTSFVFVFSEKLQVEREKLQYDADVRLRQGEVTMLQKELDSMTGTLTQLESQKKEAQKRLDELDDKVRVTVYVKPETEKRGKAFTIRYKWYLRSFSV
jgi:epidermal growth factor receptor substrate 15